MDDDMDLQPISFPRSLQKLAERFAAALVPLSPEIGLIVTVMTNGGIRRVLFEMIDGVTKGKEDDAVNRWCVLVVDEVTLAKLHVQ